MADNRPIPDAALANHIAILGKTGSGKSNSAATTVEHLIRAGERVCLIDPTDRYWGLRLMPDGKTPSGLEPVIFGGTHADLPLSANHGTALAEIVGTTTTPTIISTRLMTVGERTRFFTEFAETLLRKQVGTLHLIIDEAHLFMPKQGAKVSGGIPAMLHAGNNLVSLGRGIGLRIMLLSQRPAKLHNDSLGQVETLIAFRLILPHDAKAVREWIREWADEATGAELLSSLPSLPTGTAWLWAPELDILRRVQFPLVSTFDSGKPPAPGKKLPELRPINLATVQGKLETVAKEAVENDPRRLKARIAELEREAKKRGAPVAADPAVAEAAWQDGYQQGRSEVEADYAEKLRQRQGAIDAALGHLIAFTSREGDDIPVIEVRRQPPPRTIEHRPLREPRTVAAPKANGSAEPLPKGERACLIAIAQHPDGVTREQLTILTGYKRSTRDAYVQRLRDRGHVEPGGAGIIATGEGIAALGADYEPLPTGDELREHWLRRLPEGERKVLEAAVGFYPDAATRAEIEAMTGYKRSTRDAYIQRLRSRMLVITDAEGVRAVDTLFGHA